MSGNQPNPKVGAKPQAPLKPKILLRFAPQPKVEETTASGLTVLPSLAAAKAEDEAPAPTSVTVAKRTGMFVRGAAAAGLSAPGKKVVKPTLTRAELLARPLGENSDDENEEEKEARLAVEESAPPPPPPKPLVAAPPPKSEQTVLPPVAKAFMGQEVKPVKKSYAIDAVKLRMTQEMANTLIVLGEQLGELKLGGIDFDERTGFDPEETLVDGKRKYIFAADQSFAEPLTEERLVALDDLFRSLRIRMNSILGDGDITSGSLSPLDKDIDALFKLIEYAPKYEKEQPKRLEQEQLKAAKDSLTESMVNTLLELKTTLEELKDGGVTFASMEETLPASEGKPYVYAFTDGNTFLVVENEAQRKAAEAHLQELWPLFPGGTKITLDKMAGLGPYDEIGTPMYNDLAFLTQLFVLAEQSKIESKLTKEIGEELRAAELAKQTKTLEGTPYEALAKPIDAEMSKSPYEITTDSSYTPGKYTTREGKESQLPAQKGFIPSTRRAFGYFILDKFRRYMLEPLEKLDPNACQAFGDSASETQIYQYQKFVRDYISFMTPYRGVLVYHGLGSGKTCTAIAASEALLSSGGKKRIIVMTPFSLRKNFIQQITFCGFRHFRLLNYWTPHDYKESDGKNALWLFATTVMRIPESYLTGKRGKTFRIWIPDLNKPQSQENYTKLKGAEQAEIRNQIYETLVYEPDKKNGLIWFINYNGITASKLRDMACKAPYDIFDNSVIVIDEIHNLVRLMQGTIDQYLKKITEGEVKAQTSGQAKYLDPDRFTSEAWRPKYCGKTMNYKRGYLFYRLLVGAKNSKIIGLSGTPLINFPEELGILSNVLHGYNYIFKTSFQKMSVPNGDKRVVEALNKMAEGMDATNFCEYIDFYETTINDVGAVIELTFTFLPEGYKKVQGQIGVERIPFTERLLSTEEKKNLVKACVLKAIQSVDSAHRYSGVITESVEPLLPVMGEPTFPNNQNMDDSFKGRFVNPADGTSIINGQVLFKRLSGLISYYKGSRKDLMPEVKEGDDVVVRVPMSLDQQKKYNAIRLTEIQIEKKKEQQLRMGAAERAGPKGDDAEVKKLASSQNYRMASRQACNFVFPDGFTRPRPLSAEEAKRADEFGGSVEELLGEDQAPEVSALVGTPEEEAEQAEAEKQNVNEAREDDDKVDAEEEKQEIEALKSDMRAKGKAEGEITLAVKALQQRYALERQGELLLASAVPAEETREELSREQKRCLANILEGETYQQAINRAKECLSTLGAANLLLKDPTEPSRSPLGRWSPKYKAILENIEEIPGSSLVYSQFLGMEGIGIFTIVMKANGYVPIKVVSRGGEFVLDEETEASIRKGPAAKENRFILFTGGEDENIRKVNIDLFNAKYSEMPAKIKQVLLESGFTEDVGNKRGELCRVFCITAAGAEGLSLKNVRGVHIMEPYWNDVRMAQVKGRAIRICSHQELPLKDRNVKIYTYLTVYGREAQEARGDPREGERQKWAIPQEIWNRDGINRATAESYGISTTRDDYALTSDERLFYISERKKKLVENLIILMKSAAADCTLNYKQNMDGTFICRMLGNEGDFLYHPSLQRDFELNKRDEMGDLFTVPAKEKEKVAAALAKLTFEEEKKEEKEEEEEEEEEEAAKPSAKAEAAPKPPAKAEEAPKPKAVAPAPKRISYTIALTTKAGEKKQFVVSAIPTVKPDGALEIKGFLVYAKEDTGFTTPVGKAQAVLKDGKWLPKPGTVTLN
jgi:hypothetical protein